MIHQLLPSVNQSGCLGHVEMSPCGTKVERASQKYFSSFFLTRYSNTSLHRGKKGMTVTSKWHLETDRTGALTSMTRFTPYFKFRYNRVFQLKTTQKVQSTLTISRWKRCRCKTNTSDKMYAFSHTMQCADEIRSRVPSKDES